MIKYKINTNLEYTLGTYRVSLRGFECDIKILEQVEGGYILTVSNKDFETLSEMRVIPSKDCFRILKYVDRDNKSTEIKEDIKFTDVSVISI